MFSVTLTFWTQYVFGHPISMHAMYVRHRHDSCTSCMAVMTACCTLSSMAMMRCMYSCFSAQLTAQPRISCSSRPSSPWSWCSPATPRHVALQLKYRAVSLTYLSILREGFTPIFSATLSYEKSVSP